MSFANLALLAGLGFLIVPPIVHLFSRKKFDVVEWAAMQFLQVSKKTRRKVFLEELLLMLLRMLLLGVLVLALASPRSDWGLFRSLGSQPGRDVVLILDGSLSMGFVVEGKSRHQLALEWVRSYLERLRPGDRVALIHARQKPIQVIPYLTPEFTQILESLESLPQPRGGGNYPEAIQSAVALLSESTQQKEIVLLGDGQASGWSDEKSMVRWELLSQSTKWNDKAPKLWAVDLSQGKAPSEPNWSVSSLKATRPLVPVGREVTFKAELQLHQPPEAKGKPNESPKGIRLLVDGQFVREEKPLGGIDAKGRMPFSFPLRFSTPGSHLVRIEIEPDILPGDNVADFAIEVTPAIPVLLLDGEAGSLRKGSDFLRNALAPIRDPNPGFLIKSIPLADFSPGHLEQPLAGEVNSVPAVVILFSPNRVTLEQGKALEAFVQAGGGLLVTLSNQSDPVSLNDSLFRDGKGVLPARLVEVIGDESQIEKAAQLVPQSMEHPALELFKDPQPGGLTAAYFPRHWRVQVSAEGSSSVIASLNNRQPLLCEKLLGRGRVVLSSVPLDHRWRTNLIDLGDFVRFSHEMLYYLAGSRASEKNLQAGQSIVFQPSDGEAPGRVTVQPPESPPRKVDVTRWPLIYDETRETGPYELLTAGGVKHYFVVQPDGQESILAPLTDEEKAKVAKLIPTLKYVTELKELFDLPNGESSETELWWLFLLLLIGLLCVELYFTRRIALRYPPSE
jgi:hypothetical protein